MSDIFKRDPNMSEDEDDKEIEYPFRKEIEKKTTDLNGGVTELEVKIQEILERHHKDYLNTFDQFMESVKIDLKQKIEQMEKVGKEKRRLNDIRIITSERDFFRQEAIRLNQLCRDLSQKQEDMARENKFQSGELINISKKWKESENANKQLIVELERNIQFNKELEFHVKMSQEQASNLPNVNHHTTNDNVEDIENLDGFNKERLYKLIEKLKYELKKERSRNHFVISEFNKVLKEREKLESIFIDCVEESRKEIFNRRLKDSFVNKTHSNFNKLPNAVSFNNNDIKYEQFLPSDKKKLIEIFLMKNEVINLVKDYVFKKIDGGSIYNFKYQNNDELGQTKSSFSKTAGMNMVPILNMKKKPQSSGLHFTMKIKSAKSNNINL